MTKNYNKLKIIFRFANKNDLTAIKTLVAYLMHVEKVDDVKKQISLILKQRIIPALKSRKDKVFVVDYNKQIIGFLLLEIRRNLVASLSYLAINPQYQGLGIGRNLINRAQKYAKSKKIKILEVIVYKDNKKSKFFHKKIGFRLFGFVLRKKV